MMARGVSPTRCPLFKLLGSIMTELKQLPTTSCLAHSGSTALRTHSLFVTWRKLGVMQGMTKIKLHVELDTIPCRR